MGWLKFLVNNLRKMNWRPKNLRDSLVRASVRLGDIEDKGMRKCGKSRCQI